MLRRSRLAVLCAASALLALPACSIKKLAINSLGNALAEGGDTYASDEDPELVAAAIPFGLKTVESLLAEAPRHEGLLYAAASGFTQYAFAFVEQDADYVADQDWDKAVFERERAKKLYLRAREYGLRGLEVKYPGFRERLRANPGQALAPTRRDDVPMLYWTAAAWAAATALAIDDSQLTADQFQIEAMMRRCLELDEAWEYGAVHDFFVSYEGSRAGAAGGSLDEARKHFERAMTLSRGLRAFPLVSMAETVSVARQDRQEFEKLLNMALAIDVDALPEVRLANLVAQKRARWLLGQTEELFIE